MENEKIKMIKPIDKYRRNKKFKESPMKSKEILRNYLNKSKEFSERDLRSDTGTKCISDKNNEDGKRLKDCTEQIKTKEDEITIRKQPVEMVKQSESTSYSSLQNNSVDCNANVRKDKTLKKSSGLSKSFKNSDSDIEKNKKRKLKQGNTNLVKLASENEDPNKKISKHTLDSFVNKGMKKSSNPKFYRSASQESEEVSNDISRKRNSYKKYGISVPSMNEIRKDQKDYEEYKKQCNIALETFKDVDDTFFDLPFSVSDLKTTPEIQEKILDCKHLSLEYIKKTFRDNLTYISDIFYGRIPNKRHHKFFDNNRKKYTLPLEGLCCNTSMVVFDFDQLDYMVKLLRKEFDPDDKWSTYFFQVLLPELCLKIFAETYNMSYEEAVQYLDTRPIADD